MRLARFLPLAAALPALFLAGAAPAPPAMVRLTYHHPGLLVDLGVGLWAWPLPLDFDGDGDLDLLVSCPDTPSNGLYFFENLSGDTAARKLPVFAPGRRISRGLPNVELSWVEGQARVLAPAQEFPDFLHSGLAAGRPLALPVNIHPHKIRGNMWRYADYDGDGQLDLLVGVDDWSEYGWDNGYDASGRWTRGPLRGFVYLLRNLGTTAAPTYAAPEKLVAGEIPIETFGWPSPNLVDFDGDGDLDLLCGEFLDGFTYWQNVGTRTAPRFAPGQRLRTADGRPLAMDLQMITPTAFDWDRDGDPDLLVGDEDGRVAFIENTGRRDSQGVPVFAAPIYFQQQAENLKCGALATPVSVDWDGDGDLDLVSGNSAGYLEFFENLSGPRVAQPRWAAPRRLEVEGRPFRITAGGQGSIQGPAEAKWGYTTFSVADWDGDGLPDLVLNSILGEVVWLRNEGPRAAPRLAPPRPIEVQWAAEPPALAWGWRRPQGAALLTQWRTTPVVFDFNHDGLPDLAMLDTEGYLAFFERAREDGQLILRAPRRAFLNDKGAPLRLNSKSAGASGRRKLTVTDWDGDGHFDLLMNSANADWWRQVSEKDGTWFFHPQGTLAPDKLAGHDTSPTTADFDGDGVPDLLCGAEDGHFYFLRNPRAAR